MIEKRLKGNIKRNNKLLKESKKMADMQTIKNKK